MTDVERKALEVVYGVERDGTVILNSYHTTFSYRTEKHIVEALSRAGLLRTEEMQRVMERLTPRVLEYMKEPASLLGLRIGVPHDFPCRLEHVTSLHERALEACKQYSKRVLVSYGGAAREVRSIGEEALALEKKPERWTVERDAVCNAWVVQRDGVAVLSFSDLKFGGHSVGEARAYAAQKNAEDREAAR